MVWSWATSRDWLLKWHGLFDLLSNVTSFGRQTPRRGTISQMDCTETPLPSWFYLGSRWLVHVLGRYVEQTRAQESGAYFARRARRAFLLSKLHEQGNLCDHAWSLRICLDRIGPRKMRLPSPSVCWRAGTNPRDCIWISRCMRVIPALPWVHVDFKEATFLEWLEPSPDPGVCLWMWWWTQGIFCWNPLGRIWRDSSSIQWCAWAQMLPWDPIGGRL